VGGTYTIDGQVVTSFDPQQHGLGWVSVQYAVSDGTCTGIAVDSIHVDEDTGLGQDLAATSLRLWPNPATDRSLIEALPQRALIRVHDATGRLVIGPVGALLPLALDIHALTPGRYQVDVVRGDRTDRLPLVVIRP
jgi:hypothetical protein